MEDSLDTQADLTDLALADLAWFEGEDAGDDSGLGCNRDYRDLRGKTWADVRRVLECERRLMFDVETAKWVPGVDGEGPELDGLELGVATAVTALSALGCIPFTSCNGGWFGGVHASARLIVGFYLRPYHLPSIQKAAAQADAALLAEQHGGLYVRADNPAALMAFAAALSELTD